MTTSAYPYGFCPDCGAAHTAIDPDPLVGFGFEEEGIVLYRCKMCDALIVDGYFATADDEAVTEWK